jgi:hypothetical protein
MLVKRFRHYIRNIENNIGKKLVHNMAMVEGFVEISNGNTHIRSKNSVVDQGLIGIINYLSGATFGGGGSSQGGSSGWYSMGNSYIVIGQNTSTGTLHSTTALTTPIGGAPGTKPNSQVGVQSNPLAGQFQIQWTATWNPGTVSGTLGEVGLYLYIVNTLLSFGATGMGGTTLLFSRMASADGKFTSFSINTAVPLSIAWTFLVTYAT